MTSTKIRKISFFNYKGSVFDLTVKNLHSYNINGLAVHNSAAGMLTSYLLGITHVNPLKHNLSQDRFFTPDRAKSGKNPDIDCDFGEREWLIHPETGWLKKTYGPGFAQLGTLGGVKLKSAIRDVFRAKYGMIPHEVEKFCVRLPDEPQGIKTMDVVFGYEDTDGNHTPGLIEIDKELLKFSQNHPAEWESVIKCLTGIFRSRGRHASSFALVDGDLTDHIPLHQIEGMPVTQYNMGGVESAGILKFDFLGVSSLKDIQEALVFIQQQKGLELPEFVEIAGQPVPSFRVVPHEGELYDIWDLPSAPEVFEDIVTGKTETVFQFCTSGAQKWLKEFNHKKADQPTKLISSIDEMAIFTALDRPGPLDAWEEDENGKKFNMLQDYCRRARGVQNPKAIPALEKIIPETLGILVYQEQLQYIYQTLGQRDGIEANLFRDNISKKKMEKVMSAKPLFLKGAIPQVGEYDANRIWEQMVSWGQYGFCIDGEQLVQTRNGLVRMSEITTDMEIAYLDDDFNYSYEKPVNTMNNGLKEILEVMLSDGSTVKATEDHLFFCDNKWIPLKDLISSNQEMEIYERENQL